MRLLLLASHGIAEFDDVRMFSRLGFDVFCPGGYSDPMHPGETLRPAIPEAPDHPELRALCDAKRAEYAGRDPGPYIDWAKADLHPDLVGWADVIIVHHFVDRWIGEQWPRIRHKRVIWRTCGQSNPELERFMTRFRDDGLQIVRYSPKEREAFPDLGGFAGEDAMIRFGKYPEDYGPWIGDGGYALGPGDWESQPWIGNITQDMVGRGDATGLSFWLAATEGLPAKPAGPRSELLPGGIGALGYDEMREYLRRTKVYLYMGTYPASYTLGLIEALLTGTPVVSITQEVFGSPLFEGASLSPWQIDTPAHAREALRVFLDKPMEQARAESAWIRREAISRFGMDTIGPQWLEFLGAQAATVAA